MPPRVPTEADFAPLASKLTISLVWPKPAELTTSFLILFHGLGDSEIPFATFARNINLPGVLCISVRGINPVSPFFLGEDPTSAAASSSASSAAAAPGSFHWGDDIKLDPSGDGLDPDPGFEKATRLVTDLLIRETLLSRCGWDLSDILLFGFGQGGSLALALASQLRLGPKVEDITDQNPPYASEGATEGSKKPGQTSLKGVVSIGGPLPRSAIPTVSARAKSQTPVLACQISSEDGDGTELLGEEFEQVTVVKWKRGDVAMPRDREEMFPIMKFFADRLKSQW